MKVDNVFGTRICGFCQVFLFRFVVFCLLIRIDISKVIFYRQSALIWLLLLKLIVRSIICVARLKEACCTQLRINHILNFDPFKKFQHVFDIYCQEFLSTKSRKIKQKQYHHFTSTGFLKGPLWKTLKCLNSVLLSQY